MRTYRVCKANSPQSTCEFLQAKTREAKRSFATDTQMARLATRLMLGETIESLGLKDKVIPYYGAKEGRTLSRAYRVYFVNSQMYTASFAMQN